MRSPDPLPEDLGDAFTARDARAAGASAARLRAGDLCAPHRGVRTRRPCATLAEHVLAYAVRLDDLQAFSDVTAARLWGLPVPSAWSIDEPLVVATPHGRSREQGSTVVGHEFDPGRLATGAVRAGASSVRALGPVAAVLVLARELEHDDLVVLLDAVLTPSTHYPGLLLPRRPHATIDELESFCARCKGVPGIRAFREALADARVGSDSPQESRTRLLIVRGGLHEPVVQHPVRIDGVLVAVLDLAYPELMIDIEYEGEHHLRDPGQWDHDIARHELLERLGWIVIRLTKRDLRDGGRRALERIRRAIAARSTNDP